VRFAHRGGGPRHRNGAKNAPYGLGVASKLSLCALALLGAGLVGCAPAPEQPVVGPGVPEGFPEARYLEGYGSGGRVYRIDPVRSELRIQVYRGGRLARLGHNHVVASRDVRGFVFLADSLPDSVADLYVPVGTLIVDEPADRAAAGEGFDYTLDGNAVAGTRRNMLGGAVLDAERYPLVRIHAAVEGGGRPDISLRLAITIRGTTRDHVIPARLVLSRGRLTLSGALELRQSDFGITPYSVLGGALQVKDTLHLDYRIEAVQGSGRGGG